MTPSAGNVPDTHSDDCVMGQCPERHQLQDWKCAQQALFINIKHHVIFVRQQGAFQTGKTYLKEPICAPQALSEIPLVLQPNRVLWHPARASSTVK